ncbi:MAG: sulfate transporter ATP-binding protein [Caulobacteraceae bacterium]|nr:sulfate transporter ATP-binding protein [Caulobacteraceae bacterium]
MAISTRGIEKQYARYPALKGVSLDIQPGELLALLGPSGSGKTTLLRVIAGLEFPEKGQVLFDGEDVTYASAAERQVGFVFQQYALFKHMTLAKNIAFGLDVKKGKDKPSQAAIKAKVDELMKLVELDGLQQRYPAQLSGGQRQRVALARALALGPRVLLLDEPFGALDATVRKSLRKELRRIHDATGVTTIFVTHDQDEALELADRVAILNLGQIEQVGTPAEVYENPASAFVSGFVGEASRIEGEVKGGKFEGGGLSLPAKDVTDGPACAFVRAHDLTITTGAGFGVTVKRSQARGALGYAEVVTTQGQRLEVQTSREGAADFVVGASVKLKATNAKIYPVETAARGA